DLLAVLVTEPARDVDLQHFRAREGEIEALGDRLREGPPAEGEHPGRLDAAAAHERDVGRAAPDVDEEAAGLNDPIAAQAARDGVRLGDDGQELQVELRCDALERADVDQQGEGAEDAELEVATLESDRIGDRVAVDARAG